MRSSQILFLLLMACQPRGPQSTDTDTDGAGDADADADADSDSDADADADSDADTDPYACDGGPAQTGPWAEHPIAVAGSSATTSAPSADAGVAAVRSAAEGAGKGATIDLDVTGAIVIARDYVPAVPTDNTVSFWFEDKDATMYAYRVDVGFDPNDLAPGDEVSFKATEVTNFNGTPEVTAVTGFTLDSSANDVHVVDGMDHSVSFADDGLHVVELWGQLASDPEACGGSSNCFDLSYGGNTIIFRTGSSYDKRGDCVHWIGPVGQFDGAAQLNAGDFDWYTYY